MMTMLFVTLTFFWGVGSLFLVAVKTKSVNTIFLKKPSIIIGDFFLLPAIAGVVSNYYRNKGIEELFQGNLAPIILIISFVLTLISSLRHKLINIIYLPHGLFYWFMAFIILRFLATGEVAAFSWWLVLMGALTHLLLGILFPKKFPQIKNEKTTHNS